MKIALLQINPDGRRPRRQRAADRRRGSRRGRPPAPISPSRPSSRWSATCRAICCSARLRRGAAGTRSTALARELADRPPVLVGLPEPNPVRRRTAALQHRGAAPRRPRRAAIPQGAAADLRRLRRGPLLRAVPRRRRCSTSAARGSASASARTSGTIATSGSAAATITIRSRSSSAPARRPIVNLSASPFAAGKHRRREEMLGSMARKHRVPVAYVNQFGGNDDLRLRRPQLRLRRRRRGRSRAAAPSTRDVVICDLAGGAADRRRPPTSTSNRRSGARWCSARATTRASAASPRVVLGLSGGIDSALTAAIAAEALGADRVLGVLMPSPYSSRGSIDDSLRAGGEPRHRDADAADRARDAAMDGTLRAALRAATAPDVDRGKHPGAHPRQPADGAVEQARRAAADDRQQVGARGRLLHALRRHVGRPRR